MFYNQKSEADDLLVENGCNWTGQRASEVMCTGKIWAKTENIVLVGHFRTSLIDFDKALEYVQL